MAAIKFAVNGKQQTVDVAPQMPLLWVLRDTLGLTGTKFGCGMQLCGACTVHIDGVATRSCGARSPQSPERASRRSKGFRRIRAIRCSAPGLKWMCPSAATVSPDRSCPLPHFLRRTRRRRMRKSIQPCAAISADAEPIRPFVKRFTSGWRCDMSTNQKLGRRSFLQVGAAAAGGLLIGFYIPEKSAASGAGTARWRSRSSVSECVYPYWYRRHRDDHHSQTGKRTGHGNFDRHAAC